jgi:CDP-diacylglycerol--serine O-phosphatidyltransferase
MFILGLLRLPDLFSLANALSGFLALMFALSGQPRLSLLLIIISAVFDGLDGFFARRMGATYLGTDLDSLADLVSFGVAPAALALTPFHLFWPAWVVSSFYLICGALRLARFNVSAPDDHFFEGFPIPAAGLAVASSVPIGHPELTMGFMLLLSLFMTSSLPYRKIRDPLILLLLGMALLSAAVMIGLPWNAQGGAALVLIIVLAYLVSPVISCLQRES